MLPINLMVYLPPGQRQRLTNAKGLGERRVCALETRSREDSKLAYGGAMDKPSRASTSNTTEKVWLPNG